MARVLCIGGCHWDIRLIAQEPLLDGESTPVSSRAGPGGAVTNVARTLREVGHSVEIASVVGVDPPEISMFSKIVSGPSGRYVTVERPDGSLVYGLADLDLYDAMDAAWYADLSDRTATFDAVVLDCNATADALAAFSTDKNLYAVAVSPAKVGNFTPIISDLDGLFLNSQEAEVLGGQLNRAPLVLETMGAAGARLLRSGEIAKIWPAPGGRPGHVNGLGDRLAGLTIAALLDGMGWVDAIDHGLNQLFCGWDLLE